MNTIKIFLINLALVLVVTLRSIDGADNDKDAEVIEPPFPQMFNPVLVGNHQVHITSEIVSDDSGYQTIEEFVDLELGKQAMIVTKRDGHRVVLVDSPNDLIYNYKPYTCESTKSSEAKFDGLDGWKTLVQVAVGKENQPITMNLFGIAGLWSYASERPKTYSYGTISYSVTKDSYRRTNTWSVRDEEAKILIHLNFIDVGKNKVNVPDSMISSIRIESLESKQVIRTINVLAAEYTITDEVLDYVLQVPVGYGCSPPELRPDEGDETQDHSAWISEGARKLDLEFTGSKYEPQAQQSSSPSRSSDTLSVELAFGQDGNDEGCLQLMRIRNSHQDIKTIISHQYDTKYVIDLRKGTCELTHADKPGAEASADNPMALRFANGLTLNLDFDLMFEIFVNEVGFKTIKNVFKSGSSMQYVYQEKTTHTLFNSRTTRLVRTYVDGELFSVTIWILDDLSQQITESYHINIVETRLLDNVADLAKIFDVSEECYLNNERMKAGKDYAWFEFQYLVQSRYVETIGRAIKEAVYRQWSTKFFRSPRLEIMLNDDGFTIRMLMLDIPPVEAVYGSTSGRLNADDSQWVAAAVPELGHCSELCRLHSCKSMSFCTNTNQCLISAKMGYEVKLIEDRNCKTFSLPDSRKDLVNLFDSSLHRTIGMFQSIDYEAVAVPKMPDELIYPRSETGVDQETFERIAAEYNKNLHEFLAKINHQTPAMTFTILANERLLVLMPNKFLVEADLLSELNLADDASFLTGGLDGSGELPPFHEGLSGARYKINSFDDEQRKSSRLFTGLTYDQCALACVDARCGSFSFCNHRQECILTNFNSTARAQEKGLVEQDLDCLIGQRDFLANFNKFSGIYRPVSYTRTASAHSPSECAYNCMTATEFRCMAFSYCDSVDSKQQTGTCFYQKDRHYSPQSVRQTRSMRKKAATSNSTSTTTTGCDHYTRSYLADFHKIEGRKIDDDALAKFKSTFYNGITVFKCADICVNELTDCTAFQYCFDPDSKVSVQNCGLIQGRSQASDGDLEVEVNEKDELVKSGKSIVASANCHLFTLRKDTTEAHLRDLALGITLQGDPTNSAGQHKDGLTIGGGVLLYFIVAALFAAIGCGVCVAQERSAYVRERIERARLLIGV